VRPAEAEVSEAHASLLNRLAAAIVELHPHRIVRVGIDGADGVGKTTLADALAPIVSARGRPVIRASVDDFHHPQAVRYARGRHSPEGYYLDAYDYDALCKLLLDPLSPGGSGQYAARHFDHRIDAPLHIERQLAAPAAALIVDGVFLHRPQLESYWDLSVWLKVEAEISVPRGAQRGPGFGSPDPQAPANRRYVESQKRYLDQCAPDQKADIVIDYNDLRRPTISKWNAPLTDVHSNR
jgi:uridine kinase